MNRFDSSLDDLVPWAVDGLALLETGVYKFAETPSFGIISIVLDVNLSLLAVEKSFTRIGGVLQKLCWKIGPGSIELRGAEVTLYPLYPLCPSIDYIKSQIDTTHEPTL